MVMNKKETLSKLKDKIKVEGLIESKYVEIDETGKPCGFCAVGHLMHMTKFDIQPLLNDSRLNGEHVDRLGDIAIGTLTHDTGLSIKELANLQFVNDESYITDGDRVENVCYEIDRILASVEKGQPSETEINEKGEQ